MGKNAEDKGDTKSEDPAENDKGTGDQPDDTGKSKATDKKLLGQLVDALKGKLQSRSRNTGQQSVNPKPRGTNQVVRELNGIPAKNEGHQMSEKSDGGKMMPSSNESIDNESISIVKGDEDGNTDPAEGKAQLQPPDAQRRYFRRTADDRTHRITGEMGNERTGA